MNKKNKREKDSLSKLYSVGFRLIKGLKDDLLKINLTVHKESKQEMTYCYIECRVKPTLELLFKLHLYYGFSCTV